MNAIELYHQDGKSAGIYYCEKCRIVARTKEQAEECCSPRKCKCGTICEKGYFQCRPCIEKEREDREKARFEKAEKVTSWDGWVYCDGLGWNNNFSENLDSFLELCEYEECDIPEYVWACNKIHFCNFDIDNELQRISENSYEDFDYESFKGIEELKAAINHFNEINYNLVMYEPDYTKAVLIPKQSLANP
jgi:hypothetical protein